MQKPAQQFKTTQANTSVQTKTLKSEKKKYQPVFQYTTAVPTK